MTVDPFIAQNVTLETQEKPGTGLTNLVINPSGEYGSGAMGYVVAGAPLTAYLDTTPDPLNTAQTALTLTCPTRNGDVDSNTARTSYLTVGNQAWVAGRVQLRTNPTNVRVKLRFDSRNAEDPDGATSLLETAYVTSASLVRIGPVRLPAGHDQVSLNIVVEWRTAAASTRSLSFRVVTVARGSTEASVTNLSPLPAEPWVDRCDDLFELKVSRAEFNVGTVTADVRSNTLDPSTSPVLRAGRPARVMATLDGVPAPLMVGKIDDCPVKYEFDDPDTQRQARIGLSVVDAVADLGTEPVSRAVATIAQIPALWYAGYGYATPNNRLPPWEVNGSTATVPIADITNLYSDFESRIADQIVLTRDSRVGYAWVNRAGYACAREANLMPGTIGTLTEADFGEDIDIGFDLSTVVNVVNVVIRRVNASTGALVDVAQAPVYNMTSIEEWGLRPATYVVQGIAETTAAVRAYAAKVFAANAQPLVRVNKLTLRIDDAADLARHKSHLDLYDQLRILCPTKGVDQLVRVASIEHSITPEQWLMTVGFISAGQVATPQAVTRL